MAMTIEAVLKKQADNLLAISGVIGADRGLCDGEQCIKVFLVKMTGELEEKFQEKLSYKAQLEQTGQIKASPIPDIS